MTRKPLPQQWKKKKKREPVRDSSAINPNRRKKLYRLFVKSVERVRVHDREKGDFLSNRNKEID